MDWRDIVGMVILGWGIVVLMIGLTIWVATWKGSDDNEAGDRPVDRDGDSEDR